MTDLNILLVEDIELNVMVAKALLEKLGQRVDVAMTGQEAIDKARENTYDLILLDIQLPDMTGFDVANVLHEEDLVMQTPIVALTANVIKKPLSASSWIPPSVLYYRVFSHFGC